MAVGENLRAAIRPLVCAAPHTAVFGNFLGKDEAADRGGLAGEATESPPIASRASGSTLGCPDPLRWVGQMVAFIKVTLNSLALYFQKGPQANSKGTGALGKEPVPRFRTRPNNMRRIFGASLVDQGDLVLDAKRPPTEAAYSCLAGGFLMQKSGPPLPVGVHCHSGPKPEGARQSVYSK